MFNWLTFRRTRDETMNNSDDWNDAYFDDDDEQNEEE